MSERAMKQYSNNVMAQRGATLIVGLIMVLVITVIGLSAIRGSGLQEQMAGNMRDRQLAFQAAESALREAEGGLMVANVPIGSETGFREMQEKFGTRFWEDLDNWKSLAATYSEDIENVKERPLFLVEEVEFYPSGLDGGAVDLASALSTGMEKRYRVTSTSTGGSTDARVLVQSTYRN